MEFITTCGENNLSPTVKEQFFVKGPIESNYCSPFRVKINQFLVFLSHLFLDCKSCFFVVIINVALFYVTVALAFFVALVVFVVVVVIVQAAVCAIAVTVSYHGYSHWS